MAKYKIIPSSRTIVQSPISIGHKAEKGVEAIEFDVTAWVETYGSGTLTVIMRRWGDAIPYPIALEIDENNKATWTLSDTDTAKAGMAYAQLSYVVGDEVVKKSDIYTFRVMDSLTGEGDPPEAYESWLEHLTHLAAEAMAEVLDIEGIVTDKTLTVDGGIADAKATGDALALKADKSTTYTKTEVDRMIEDVEVETDTTLEIAGAAADAAETGRQIGLIKADLDAVIGEQTDVTFTETVGIMFAENGVKYVAQASYAVWYLPISSGAKYHFDFVKSNSNSVTYQIATSDDIPTANGTGTYVDKVTVPAYGTADFNYVADKDGYLGLCRWYQNHVVTLTGTVTSGGVEIRMDVLSAEVQKAQEATETASEFIERYNGKTIEFESGTYWYGNYVIGTTTESNVQSATSNTAIRKMITLPAGKTLRLVALGSTASTRLYCAFDATTGILIDISDTTEQLKLQAHYLRYDVDTHIYINHNDKTKDYFCQIVDDVSPWMDLSRSLGVSQDNVLNLNDNVRYAVRSLRRPQYQRVVPVTFLHFSDIHGDALELQRIMDFAQDGNISPYIHDIICTGDIPYLSLDDTGVDFLDDVSGAENILLLVGNHDTAEGVGSSGTTYGTATPERVYNELFKDRIANWNVTQPANAATEYLGYYYKDYATQKLRLICLDANHGSDYISAQTTWLESVLLSAYNAGYSVICANHYMFSKDVCSVVDCSFSPRKEMSNEGSWTIPANFITAVETFIGYGGEFVCWFGGHVHQDHVILHNNGHQLCIGVSTASHDSKQTGYGDDLRLLGTRSQDLFNIMAIDTYSKHISILRVGSNLTRLMHSKNHLCIDYSTRQVIWND